MSYIKDTTQEVQESGGFRGALQRSIDKRIAHGRAGIRMDDGETVFHHFFMDITVFELGCAIAKHNRTLCPHTWAAWMMNARVQESANEVLILMPTVFRCRSANQRLGDSLRDHFKCNVRFQASPSLREEMENV